MKTAEEWQEKLLKVECMKENEHWLIQQIQLDAYKAGMTRAAEIVDESATSMPSMVSECAMLETSKSILTTRDLLKEIPT